MNPNAAAIIDEVIETEGGLKLINVKNDRGKQTYAGISRRFWPNWDGWKLVDRGRSGQGSFAAKNFGGRTR